MGGFGKKKASLGREEEAEEVFVPDKGDQAGILLYELRAHILALPAGQEVYRDLLKLLSLPCPSSTSRRRSRSPLTPPRRIYHSRHSRRVIAGTRGVSCQAL